MKNKVIILSVFLFIFTGCSTTEPTEVVTDDSRDFSSQIKLSLNNIYPVDNGHYEGWLLVDGKTISIGKFTIGENGDLVDLDGNKIEDNRFTVNFKAKSDASRFMLTMESNEDDNEYRSTVVVLEGNFSPLKESDLYFAAYDTESMTGQYELRAYSDESNDQNQSGGIWFCTKDDQKKRPLLDMPDLNEGWIYEAWISKGDKNLSLGQFSSVKSADLSNLYQLDKINLPKYPGEDLLKDSEGNSGYEMPLNLSSGEYKVFITLEPFSSKGEDLSGKKPNKFTLLEAKIPAYARIHTPLDLVNSAVNNMPSGKLIYIPKLSN